MFDHRFKFFAFIFFVETIVSDHDGPEESAVLAAAASSSRHITIDISRLSCVHAADRGEFFSINSALQQHSILPIFDCPDNIIFFWR
jgi:hypothetical protein